MPPENPPSPSSSRRGSNGSPPEQVASPAASLGVLLAKLTRLSARIVSSLDPEETFHATLEALWQVLPAGMVLLQIAPEGAKHLILAASAGLTTDETALLTPCLPLDGKSISARAARARAPLLVALPEALQEDAPGILSRLGFASILCLPLLLHDRLLGTLLVGSRRANAFCPEDVAVAEALAQIVAPAVDRAAVHVRTIQAKARADALAEIGRALTSSLELKRVLEIIVEKTVAATQSEACGIFRWDAGREVFAPVAVRGLSARFQHEFAIARHEGLSGWVLEAGQPAWTDDVLADPRFQFSPSARELIRAEGFRSLLVVPILVQAEAFGTLVAYRWQPHEFTEEEVRFQAAVADQAAIALENARLYGEASRHREQAEAMAEIAQDLAASLDLHTLLEKILRHARSMASADVAYVGLVDSATGLGRIMAGSGQTDDLFLGVPVRPGHGVGGIVLATGRPHSTVDYQTDPHLPGRYLEAAERAGVRAALCVPILHGNRTVGLLWAARRMAHAFTPEEEATLCALASQAAVAIENARLFQQEQERRRQIEAVRAVTEEITRELDLPVLLRLIHRRAMELVGASSGCIHLWDEAAQVLVPKAWHGVGDWMQDVRLRAGEGISGVVAQRREGLTVNDYRNWPQASPLFLERTRVTATLGEPLLYRDRLIGVITVDSHEAERTFTEQDRQLLGLFAAQAAIAIENARLYAEAREGLAELAAIHEAGQGIAQSLDLQETLQRILAAATRLTETDKGIIWLLDADQQALVGTVVVGLPGETEVRLSVSDRSLVTACLQEGRVLISESPEDDPRCNPALQARFENRALIAVPLRSGDRIIGVLDLGDLKRRRGFARREIGILERLAQQAVVAIENARLYAETRKAYDDLRAAQEQLLQVEKLRALGEMAGGVAHDFNNILATVLARAQLLQAQTADPHLRHGLQVIERAALDGAETVRRILGFARARPEARYAPVDLAALLQQVLEVTRPRWKDEAQRRGAAIEAVLDVEPVPAVLGSAAELREVFVNLIFNAVDALPRGGRLILGARRLLRPGNAGGALNPHRQVLAGRVEEMHELVEVWVQDTGAGMPEAVRRRAFDPFFTTKGIQGTGLGLSVVYGIIQRHGGEVLLESQEGAGTTVIIRLPATAEGRAAGAESGAPATAPAARIVVVDDEEVLASALADILRLQRHRVDAFTDPRRALEHVAREPVDLLFTDLGMPDFSGLEMTRQARTLRPGLPVVLVTGWGHQVDPETLTTERVNALLAKPYRMEDVLHVVAEVLPPAPS